MIQNLQMIPRNEAYWQDNEWKKLISGALSEPMQLLEALDVSPEMLPYALDLGNRFKQKVPLPFIEKIRKGDPLDPLLLQVLPLSKENQEVNGFSQDPLAEQATPVPGLLHKYASRALIMLATTCAINCRYCFRREFPYAENNPSRSGWPAMFDYLKQHPQINEVILSGGDPLAVNDQYLAEFIQEIEKIPHIIRLRIHTRLPIVIPQRVTQKLAQTLNSSRLQAVMVIHCNHPNELDHKVLMAMQRLQQHGVQLLNQSVLLKQINDNPDTLVSLSEKLFSFGVMPYYLHLLDKVRGSAHFEVSEDDAVDLMQQMQSRLAGFLVPKLAREEARKPSKTLIAFS